MQTFTPQDKTHSAEGILYKVLHVRDTAFPLYYGFYEEFERNNPGAEPIPIYPDFLKEPQYTHEGVPFVTKMQDACTYYEGTDSESNECGECSYFEPGEELMGICNCPNKREVQ